MAGGFRAPAGDGLEIIADELKKIGERLAELEAPTGTSINSLVAQVQQAIAEITTTVNAAISTNSYTKAQIDSKVASPGAIAPTTVTASGDVQVNGQLRDPDAASFNITGTRLTVWVETATGRFGNTASSRKYKQDEAPADIDPEAVMSIAAKTFHYIAEIRKRDDPTFEEYVGPDYVVAAEHGFMAEDLHDAGLHPWVIYRDTDGAIEPESVDYVMWVVALQIAVRKLAADRDSNAARVDDLEARITALEALVNPEGP